MNKELDIEINYFIDILSKSGFYSEYDILENLEEEFFDEDINFKDYSINLENSSNSNFSILEKAFTKLSKDNDIVAIHNCGYDIEEGVDDAFELFIHLKNNNFNPVGFCFYTFKDIEKAICEKKLKITFGDFENNENKALEIGKIVFNTLKGFNLNIIWDKTINSQIEINPLNWDKSFNENQDYEIEGAFDVFKKNH